MPNRKIVDLLAEGQHRFGPLNRLLSIAEQQRVWTSELRAVLPDAIRRDCDVVSIQDGTLVVVVRSAAAATRLRFMAPEVLDRLRVLSHFSGLQALKVRVSPN